MVVAPHQTPLLWDDKLWYSEPILDLKATIVFVFGKGYASILRIQKYLIVHSNHGWKWWCPGFSHHWFISEIRYNEYQHCSLLWIEGIIKDRFPHFHFINNHSSFQYCVDYYWVEKNLQWARLLYLFVSGF